MDDEEKAIDTWLRILGEIYLTDEFELWLSAEAEGRDDLEE